MKTNIKTPFLYRVSHGERSADIPVRSNVGLEKPPANSDRAAIRKLLRTGMSALLPALIAVLLFAQTTMAATITVTSTADSGAGTLRDALASAANGDTIDAS